MKVYRPVLSGDSSVRMPGRPGWVEGEADLQCGYTEHMLIFRSSGAQTALQSCATLREGGRLLLSCIHQPVSGPGRGLTLGEAVPYVQGQFPVNGTCESASEIPSSWGVGARSLNGASERHNIYSTTSLIWA